MRFADTIDYIARYTAELLKMKAQGKSNGEMLAYLHTRRIQANLGDIAEFWKYQEQQQKQQQSGQQRQERQARSKGGTESEVEKANTPNGEEHPQERLPMASGGLTALRHCPELFRMRAEGKKTEELLCYLQSIGVHTTFSELLRTMNLYREWLAEKEKERAEQNTKMPGGNVSAAPESKTNERENENTGDIGSKGGCKNTDGLVPSKRSEDGAAKLMTRFERILDQKFDDYDFGTDRSSANLKDINLMIRTVISYEKDQARQEYRKELLKIKKADLELRAKQAEARQKAADNNGSADDFDNTEDIAHLRKESFRDVDEYLASGEVDDKIVEAKRKAKAAGAQVEEYVPPPLGTGLWTKPAKPGPTAAGTAPAINPSG
jgi:hypothetical protein